MTPAEFGRAIADRETPEAILGLLAGLDASEAAQARVSAKLPPDEASFLAAKRARLIQIREGLGRAAGGK